MVQSLSIVLKNQFSSINLNKHTYLLTIFSVCDCDQSGAHPEICDKVTGQCLCQDNFVEPRCDSCKPSFYRYPICEGKNDIL